MVSNARDISSIKRYSYFLAHIVFPADILNVKTGLVILRPGLYAAADIDITFLKRSNFLPITIIARISRKPDNKMTALKFFHGTFRVYSALVMV